MSASAPVAAAVAWHDAECGGYGADLPAWERLAREYGDPVLDLGAGTGRVALHLAARGFAVVAVDVDPDLIGALAERAAGRRATVEAVCADLRDLDLGRRFPLIIAPMQVVHLLGGGAGRARALAAARRHLAPGGALALSILPEPLPPTGGPEPVPDVCEVDGWIHSSLPLEVRVGPEVLELVRLRQIVSPAGELSEELDTIALDRILPAQLDEELDEAGFDIVSSEPMGATELHIGSILVVAEVTDG